MKKIFNEVEARLKNIENQPGDSDENPVKVVIEAEFKRSAEPWEAAEGLVFLLVIILVHD